MLARSIALTHPDGSTCQTPLLVPSFSSKGFGYRLLEGDSLPRRSRPTRAKGRVPLLVSRRVSEASTHLEATGSLITESLLLSAYDMHFDLLDRPIRFFKEKTLVFIDSGGYELAPEYDSSEPKHFEYKPRRGYSAVAHYMKVLDSLPSDKPCVIANFDHPTRHAPIATQVQAARRLFSRYPQFGWNFLIKPGCEADGKPLQFINVNRYIRPELNSMRGFHIVGVTEKELGATLVKKLEALTALRLAMDDEGLGQVPIHLWGGLDPLLTPLFFFAGASIFDGVGWLRYAFHDGVAVSWDSAPILQRRVGESDRFSDALTVAHNLGNLQSLSTSLRRFVQGECKDFSVFTHHSEDLAAAYQALGAHVSGLRRADESKKGAN